MVKKSESSQLPSLHPTSTTSTSLLQQKHEKDEQPQGNHITNTKPSSTLAKDENTTKVVSKKRRKK